MACDGSDSHMEDYDQKDSKNWVTLCSLCSTFCHSADFQRVLRNELDSATYVNSTEHFTKFARECQLCQQLRESYENPRHEKFNLSDYEQEQYNESKLQMTNKIEVRAWDRSRGSSLCFDMKGLGTRQDWTYSLATLFWVHASPNNHAAKHFRGREVQTDLNSSSAWRWANQWLSRCKETHHQCGAGTSLEKPLPGRVIDVSGPEARLYCTNREPAQYAALSYCWGRDQPLKTTQQNIQDYMTRIEMENLPRTIQDAITASRRLGLRYLWIDSLCIIQDDEVDKRREISRMRDVFKDSTITIVAASAESVDAGFLGDRPDPPPISLRLPFVCERNIGGTILLRHEDWCQYDPVQDATEKRAWCLGEGLLSARLLIYTANHLRWRCQKIEDCHGGHLHNRYADEGESPRLATQPRRETDNPAGGSEEDSEEDKIWESWQNIVLNYTRRALTHPKDKLIAIAGLADEFQRATGDRYFAGLWQKHLAEDLLWFHYNKKSQIRPRPSIYRAPSWSWASVDSEVRRYRGTRSVTKHFQVINCCVKPASEEAPLGMVKSGRLLVRSRVRLAIWDPQESELYQVGEDEDVSTLEHLAFKLKPTWLETAFRIGKAKPDAKEPVSRQPGYVLCLSIGTLSGVWGGQEGLVLARAEDFENEVAYRRVSSFYLSKDDDDDDWFEGAEERDIVIV